MRRASDSRFMMERERLQMDVLIGLERSGSATFYKDHLYCTGAEYLGVARFAVC